MTPNTTKQRATTLKKEHNNKHKHPKKAIQTKK